jgi:hypothetical protein
MEIDPLYTMTVVDTLMSTYPSPAESEISTSPRYVAAPPSKELSCIAPPSTVGEQTYPEATTATPQKILVRPSTLDICFPLSRDSKHLLELSGKVSREEPILKETANRSSVLPISSPSIGSPSLAEIVVWVSRELLEPWQQIGRGLSSPQHVQRRVPIEVEHPRAAVPIMDRAGG